MVRTAAEPSSRDRPSQSFDDTMTGQNDRYPLQIDIEFGREKMYSRVRKRAKTSQYVIREL